MIVNKLEKYHDEFRVLMKLYYWFKSMSGVLNNVRGKNHRLVMHVQTKQYKKI